MADSKSSKKRQEPEPDGPGTAAAVAGEAAVEPGAENEDEAELDEELAAEQTLGDRVAQLEQQQQNMQQQQQHSQGDKQLLLCQLAPCRPNLGKQSQPLVPCCEQVVELLSNGLPPQLPPSCHPPQLHQHDLQEIYETNGDRPKQQTAY